MIEDSFHWHKKWLVSEILQYIFVKLLFVIKEDHSISTCCMYSNVKPQINIFFIANSSCTGNIVILFNVALKQQTTCMSLIKVKHGNYEQEYREKKQRRYKTAN